MKFYPIRAIPKPRMTRRDKWKKRPIVLKYRAFKDELRMFNVKLDVNRFYHIVFVLPHPTSWSHKKRHEHWFTPHQQTPDKDNLEKALLDGLFSDDSAAWDGRVTKVWGPLAYIIISESNLPVDPDSIRKYLIEDRK